MNTGWIATADRWFGNRIPSGRPRTQSLATTLTKANLSVLPREYLAFSVAVGLFGATVGLFTGLVTSLVAQTPLAFAWVAPILMLLAGGTLAYGGSIVWPILIAAERGSNIDDNLPFAMEYLANIVGPGTSFINAARQVSNPDVHGQLAQEMQKLVRDLTVLGLDRVDALTEAMRRSPSVQFSEVLQGIATTLAAGGDLADYFSTKASDLRDLQESKRVKSMDNLGVLAELFIVTAIAVPLLLMILLVAVAIFNQGGTEVPAAGYQLFSILVPLLYAAFTAAIVIYKPPM